MPAEYQSRPTVSTTQLMSSALAAVTAAVVGSRLGIAGTLVGAAAGSVIGTVGTAMYGHWLDRTASRVRTVVRLPAPRSGVGRPETTVIDTVDDTSPNPAETTAVTSVSTVRQPTWRTVGLAALATFAVAIGSITAFEAIAGQPVSTLTGGDAGTGTTLGRAVGPGPGPTVFEPDPAPSTPTPITTPTTPTTPSPTPTDSPTTAPPTTTPEPSTIPPTSPPPTTPTPPPTAPPE